MAPQMDSVCRPRVVCWTLGVILVLVIGAVIGKDVKHPEANSDLVFDDKQSTNHDRIPPAHLSNPHPLEPPHDLQPTSWLSNTYNRVKRDLFDLFGSDDDDSSITTTTDTPPTTIPTPTAEEEEDNGPTTLRVIHPVDGQSQEHQNGSQEEDVDDNGEGVDEDNDVGDDYDQLGKDSENAEKAYAEKNGGVYRRPFPKSDDEDDDAENSGDIGSQSGSHSGSPPVQGKPAYFRITFTVEEPFHEAYDDKTSDVFKELSEQITQSIQKIYENLDGIQTATVIKIGKVEGETFQSRVTLDLGTKNFYDQEKIKNMLLDQIRDYHTLGGSIQVTDDDFRFIPFGVDNPLPPACDAHELECNNGECVPGSSRCNGIVECGDGSDENGCEVVHAPTQPTTHPPTAPSVATTSDYGEPTHHNIDPTTDTTTGGHEPTGGVSPLPTGRCRADDFIRCNGSSVTICEAQLCDGEVNCPGGGDEENCSSANDCAMGELSCDIYRCIPQSQLCDGQKNCDDGTDEQGCDARCRPDQFQCEDSRCIEDYQRCDGHQDCPSGKDETFCPPKAQRNCTLEEFMCASDGQCIDINMRCDDYEDCADESDEANCPTVSCRPDEFECGPQECVPITKKCDGEQDCQNALDEHDCPQLRPRCSGSEFQCQSDGACIPLHGRCDGTVQCRDQSDEIECGCKPNEFSCRSTGQCIPQSYRCDRRRDCPDNSDEEGCPGTAPQVTVRPPAPASCPQGQQPCRTGKQCLPYAAFCDGRVDCNDFSDEENCAPPLTTTTDKPTTWRPPVDEPPVQVRCDWGYFRCENGPCIQSSLKCNGRVDCPHDASDEMDCGGSDYEYGGQDGLNLRTYPSSQEILERREVVFQCRDEGPIRARVHWTRANGLALPPGTRDLGGRLEMPNIQVSDSGAYICAALGYPSSTPGAMAMVNLTVDPYVPPTVRPATACSLGEATCSNGECVPRDYVCDGKNDCSDGTDESRCSPHGCEPNEFRCRNKRCVLKTWQCDSENDCDDGSDEEGCDALHVPGAPCRPTQFSCDSGNMCIPKSYHCDGSNDCSDNSDEIGCVKPVISRPPPPMTQLDIGALFQISCSVVGIPVPEIVWRLNWGHVPAKCSYVSVNGVGTITCPDIQEEDQGAYSCEAINIKGRTFAVPDTILVVNPERTVCPRGSFNEEARRENECLSCFCFGVTTDCRSADLFVYQLQPPFDSHNVVAVHVDPVTGIPDIRDSPSLYRGAPPRLTPLGRNSVQARYNPIGGPVDIVPYFALPENHLGNQLKSYGGYVKYGLRIDGSGGRPIQAPDVIMSGNGYTLVHSAPTSSQPPPGHNHTVSIRFFVGEWTYRTETAPERPATREEIMMALADVRHILVRLQYTEGAVDTTLSNVEMDSAGVTNVGLGQANLVEECRCPVGYSGLSCENCASGFSRHRSGPWLGQCFKEVETCPPGTYGDPSRGITCQTCPCPLTHPTNQFGRTCSLDSDGDVTCDCPPGYVGRRCEKCDNGYTGNPLIPGDYCKIGSICNANGSASTELDQYGQCRCKENTDGPTCDNCKPNTFFLNRDNQFGCVACFCMGITSDCTSSNYYRTTISTGFTNSINDFKLIRLEEKQTPISSGIRLDQNSREIVYSDFRQPDTYYWSLPSRFLGDKVTAYGGNLRYALRYVPIPGGQSSKNNAPDVELISENHINLLYFAKDHTPPPDTTHTFTVPILEQYWQRSDGQKTDREHLLMALADLKTILIKASYTTNTREAALQSVSLDIADERNTGSYERASAVEQCHCPAGYTGLSCEDCDAGFTRSTHGIYLGLCQPCACNGNSNDCDAESGVCHNCRSHTAGDNCDQCQPGYVGDPAQREPCRPGDGGGGGDSRPPSGRECDCDEAGIMTVGGGGCVGGLCQCKTNVEGYRCDRCRDGTFGLSTSITEGCQSCFCSGIVTDCRSSDLYLQQIPSQIIDDATHGFTLTDQYHRQPISAHFQLNVAMNEIGYVFRPSNTDRPFWSLPAIFTGNKIKSYGGKLEFNQRFTERPDATYNIDQDIIISGNGVTIFWTNPVQMQPNIANRISVPLSTAAKWQRASHHAGPRPASREDLMRVLANIDYILVRAKPSSDTASTFISDITLDTAVETYTGQARATSVEVCRCSEGYRGTSCEQCKPGYYRDVNDVSRGPLGSCTKCPCSSNSQGCALSPENEIVCTCTPGWTGRLCENAPAQPVYPGPINDLRPNPPTITITISAPPNLTIQSIGSTVRYTCSARSTNPNPVRLQWSRSNGELPQRAVDDRRGLLVITDLRVSDSGTYVCHAFDGVSVNVKEVNLIVGTNEGEVPRVSIQPAYVQVHVGQPIDLTCSAVGNPTPYLQWNRKDGQPMNDRHTFQNGIFHIGYALETDQGVYECSAQNSAGYDRLETTVYVLSRPEPTYPPHLEPTQNEPRISPAYHSGRPGDTVTFRCSSGSGQDQAQIVWQRADTEGGQLPYSSRDDGRGQLQFRESRVDDSGSYECKVINRDGSIGIGRAVLNITDGQGTVPSVSISPDRNLAPQGSSIELHCQVGGSPTPTIKWSRLGSNLPSHVTQTSTTLHLTNIQMTDRDVYICVATNVHGYNQASTILEVEPREPPIVEMHPQSSQTVSEGGQTLLQCRLSAGTPNPTITWSRSSGQTMGPNVEEMSGGVLKLSDITTYDAGDYICTAENAAGRASATGNIIVQSSPRVTISPPGGVYHAAEGREVRIECEAQGSPDPTVQWNRYEGRDRVSYPVRSMSRTTHMAVLQITSATASDSGIYVCLANNAAGAREERVQLIVNGSYPQRGDITDEDATGDENELHPLQPGWGNTKDKDSQYRPALINEKITAPVGTRAELRCKFEIENDRNQFVINWERDGNTPLPGNHRIHDGVLYIESVQTTDAGVYRCYGINTRTNSVLFTLNADLEVTSPPRITLRPPKQVVRPGESATIECRVTGDQPISVEWEAVQRDMPRSVRVHNNLLQFHGIEVTDAGRYLCRARNSAGESDSIAEVLVQENQLPNPGYDPNSSHTTSITAQTHEYHVTTGDNVRLQCNVHSSDTARAPTVNWSKDNGRSLPRNSRVDEGVLELFDVQPEYTGRYMCEVSTDAGGRSGDYIQVYVNNRRPVAHVLDTTSPASSTAPRLHIRPNLEQPTHTGDNLDVQCSSSEPGVITTWAKLHGPRRADNVRTMGGTLRIVGVRLENSGVYRCEAKGYAGRAYSEDYTVEVVDSLEKETMPLDVKTVPKGSSIIMHCSTNLEPPVQFKWSRQGGEIPSHINPNMNQLKLEDVSAKDAGIYICSSTSNHRTINTPTVLVVTGILPYFSQAPISFISLPMMPDAYNHFTFEISIKPQSPDGLILYNGNNRNTEFISLALVDGRPEFKINMGNGVTTLDSPQELEMGQWHTIKVTRNKKKITMYVDGTHPHSTTASTRYSTLDLSSPLYLAGHPALATLTPVLNVNQGLVGCVSRLKVGPVEYDLMADAHSTEGVTTCEECSGGNQCENGGVCQEELSREGYKCVCREGYGGRRCERRSGQEDVCLPDTCGPNGRCTDTTTATVQCHCPLGRVGPRCAQQALITVPAFSGNAPGAYVAYPTPRAQRRLKISLQAKPADLTDGLLVYCAETEEGHGEFVSLALRGGHLEFRFDVGNGVITLRSMKPFVIGQWHAISASKTFSDGRLIVDGEEPVAEKTTGNHRTLNLQTALYVGGVDQDRVTVNEGVGMNGSGGKGFHGCISDISVSGMNLHIINSITDSSNVQECSTLGQYNDDFEDDYGQNRRYNNIHNYYPTEYSQEKPVTYKTRETGCSSSPCRNDGQCYPLSPVEYRCNCINGYSGTDCEVAPPLCQHLAPCQHSAPCTGNTTHYHCDCPIRYTGTNCEQTNELRADVHVEGDGWLEMPAQALIDSYGPQEEGEIMVALEISTNETSGLLFWYGRREGAGGEGSVELEVPGEGGVERGDYMALQVVQGYLEFSYDLGSGPGVILNDRVNVSDNIRHRVILKLKDRDGSIDVDDVIEHGKSEGTSKRLNANGNMYLGGVPDYKLLTLNRFRNGFNGCIHAFEINDSKTLDIGTRAINGSNVRSCSSYEGISHTNEIDDEDDDYDLVN